MSRPFHTAPMKGGIRYDAKGEPIPPAPSEDPLRTALRTMPVFNPGHSLPPDHPFRGENLVRLSDVISALAASPPSESEPTANRECSTCADPVFCASCAADDHPAAALRAAAEPREGLDVDALMVAIFEAERPGDWPTWADYIAAFGSPATPPWRRKAERLAAEYARLIRPTGATGEEPSDAD